MRRWIDTKDDARMWQLELILRAECQAGRGMMWLSARTLSRRVMFKSISELNRLRDRLVATKRICYVTAPGRGQGKGRTLYWLPTVRERHVLRALREEKMPDRAIARARAFFLRPENDSPEERQQPLRSTDLVAEERNKDARARAERLPPPNGPPRPQPTPNKATSTPPSLGRLTKHGFRPLSAIAAALSTITENPSSHPHDCECGCRSSADNSPKLGGP